MNITEQDILNSLEKACALEKPAHLKISRPKRTKKTSKKFGFTSVKSIKKTLFKYQKQILTFSLSSAMVIFALFSSYIAYAYVVSDETNIISEVKKHAVLPLGETPKVYIVQSEKSEMYKNPFYGNPEIGDNVVVYETLGKVVVYRKTEGKIVNIVNHY